MRYIARQKDIDAFLADTLPDLGQFILYGSGDFHHLAGALIRRISDTPFTLVSFDNHPDWDIKPPYWACGGWAARTLKTGQANKVSVWGCGNFELQWPARLTADWKALRAGALEVHAWAERQPVAVAKRFNCMTRDNWRSRFQHFAAGLKDRPVYITVDLDCLRAEEAVTNWENGLFTAEDVAWAIGQLRASATVLGGDVCGAWSAAAYARTLQRLASRWDHPAIPIVDANTAQQINARALAALWPALTGENSLHLPNGIVR